MLRRALMFACALVLVSQPAWAREYFVAPGGSDTAAGTQQAPWRSVARVNSATLVPGDIVRFAGGGVWNAMLAPRASGTAGAPVVFSTYGSGRAVLDGTGASGYAGVAVTGRSSLVFEHLTLRGWKAGNQAVYLAGAVAVRFDDVSIEDSAEGFHQSPSAPSTGVTISHSHVAQIDGGAGSGVGINVTSGSAGWHVSDTVIEHVADSCVIDQGADSLYERVTAADCGFGGLTYGTHGFYLKGPRQTLRDSSIRHAFTNCISVRFQDATIVGNTVSDCPIGIAWFEDATAPGTVTIVRNRVSDAGTGIYVDSSPTQSFSISQNTIIGGRRSGAKTDAIVSNDASRVAITNNVVAGAPSQAARRRRHPGRRVRRARERAVRARRGVRLERQLRLDRRRVRRPARPGVGRSDGGSEPDVDEAVDARLPAVDDLARPRCGRPRPRRPGAQPGLRRGVGALAARRRSQARSSSAPRRAPRQQARPGRAGRPGRPPASPPPCAARRRSSPGNSRRPARRLVP